MLKRDNVVLVFIDVQGRLHELMHEKELLDHNLEKLVRCADMLNVPVVRTEQIPEKLGLTSEPFKTLLTHAPGVSKSSFSCWGEPRFVEVFQAFGKRKAILVGIEAHVCIYQTALDLLEEGIEVLVISDAVSSRVPENKALALQAMRDEGAKIISTEMALFALLRDAGDPNFKKLLQLVK